MSTHLTLPELAYEDVTGDNVKSLAEVKVVNIHHSPLIYPARHAIIEGNQIGQASFNGFSSQSKQKESAFESLFPWEKSS